MPMSMPIRKALAAFLPILPFITACSSFSVDEYLPDHTLAYKQQREAGENLELPPDLVSGKFDDAMDVPDAGGSATYSEYVGERKQKGEIAKTGDVLPDVKDVTYHREGDRRWIEINAKPQALWPRLESFWRERGILLTEKNPTTGVMVTDWIENRAEIKSNAITDMLRKVMDSVHSTGTRDQYRLRLEPGPKPGTTDIFLTHRGMEERLMRNTVAEDSNTMWEATPSDPGKEAAMLRSIMMYLGVTSERAKRIVSEGGAVSSATSSGSVTTARSRLEEGGNVLVIDDELRNAWRLVGVALDRSGFAVEDRDMSQGVYYVRYDDSSKEGHKKGFFSKMAFWRDDKVDTVTQYQVRLTANGKETRVQVLDKAGNRDNSPTAQNILALVKDQMR